MTSTRELEDQSHISEATMPPSATLEALLDLQPTRNLAYYRRRIGPHLDPAVFAPNPKRLIWYASCMSLSIASFVAIVWLNPAWPVKLLLGLVIGYMNGTLGFVCHELFHGSIIKSTAMQNFLGFFGTLPFLVSPTYWRMSHNRLHHGKTQQLIRDPDAFPNLRVYKSSKFIQFMFPFTPGSGHKRSSLYFFFWFTFHNLVAQVNLRFKNRIFDHMNHRRATVEMLIQFLIVAALAIYAGPANWFWCFIIPIVVQNYLLMSYISTNHNLSPLDEDPLANSLSVSNHPIFEYLHLNFGYHVEHHIYPTVSGKNIKAIHYELQKQFPEQYKFIPKMRAMRLLYQTPRIYKNTYELIHPENLKTSRTI